MVSCETPIDQPVCAVANFESCTSYEQWTGWIEWTLSDNGRQVSAVQQVSKTQSSTDATSAKCWG